MVEPYRVALLRARMSMGALEAQAAREVAAVLREYARTLEAAIAQLGPRADLEAARRLALTAARRMDGALGAAVQRGRNVSFQTVMGIWRQSMRELAAVEGVSGATLGRIRFPVVTMLGQFASLGGGQHWRTLIRTNAIRAGEEAGRIIGLALQAGVGPEELARRMRRYVTGAEPFLSAFQEVPTRQGDLWKLDLRRLKADERQAARTMRHSAMRIAVSERHNARAEAEAQHMMADPFVEAVRWRLSANRSFNGTSFVPPDECDYLATVDSWGLGPGIFPVDRVPPPPHPFDRCEKEPLPRGAAQMRDPKPTGIKPSRSMIMAQAVPRAAGLSRKRVRRIKEHAWGAIDFGIQGYPDIQVAR